MKTTSIVLTALAMTMSSFTSTEPCIDAAGSLAAHVVTALKHTSIEEYTALFPTLHDFDKIMNQNAALYKGNLEAAKIEFEEEYMMKVLPALKESFASLISEGKKAGINWSEVTLTDVSQDEQPSQAFDALTCTLTLSSNRKQFRVKLDKVLVIDGEWKVTQFIKLED